MGTRLSRPSSPSGSEEAASTSLTSTSTSQRPPPPKRPQRVLPRLFVPISAVLFGSLIFVYSRTTIAAAKENARRAREADGGSISWRREGMRRHGRLEKVEERTLWGQLIGEKGKTEESGEDELLGAEKKRQRLGDDTNPIEEGIRKAREQRIRAQEKKGDEEE